MLTDENKGTALITGAATGPLLDSDVEKMDEMVALNVRALMRLTYAAVPGGSIQS